MYARLTPGGCGLSFFLLGPRATGKSSWVKTAYPEAVYLDLLDSGLYTQLLAAPQRLEGLIRSDYSGMVVLDEVQKVPAVLDEVHRLIEGRNLHFVLTGSSARKLRRKGVNLLAGRARTRFMHALTATELGEDFSLAHSLRFGCLPSVYVDPDPKAYLQSYVATYLKEEVQQEGLTRNVAAFGRFLEAASFSQASPLNISQVARECSVQRKTVEEYFGIVEDLLLAVTVPVFERRAKRKLSVHPKFYFFDAGVFRTLRPAGPLDSPAEIDGAALETLVLQQLRAINDYRELGYGIYYWRTRSGLEVDFILYGERGLLAIEVKRTATVRPADLRGLREFCTDYPAAEVIMLYGGSREYRQGNIRIVPIEEGLRSLDELLTGSAR